jgi:hypothetical protein
VRNLGSGWTLSLRLRLLDLVGMSIPREEVAWTIEEGGVIEEIRDSKKEIVIKEGAWEVDTVEAIEIWVGEVIEKRV